MFQLDSDVGKVIMSLMNIVLMIVPLVSIIFTTIHFYNSYEFIELMLAQPVDRKVIYLSEYFSTTLSLCIAYLIGVGLPIVFYGMTPASVTLLYAGLMLTMVFVSLAFLASVLTRDKAKAIGVTLLFWFYFALIYDGLLLWIVYTFSDYPLEKLTIGLIALNPIDLARIMMLLKLDISALMGYTGAFYQQFFGSYWGIMFSTGVLLTWVIAPIFAGTRIFIKKDL
jgi:Cu-processing system permease protein